MAAGCVSSDGHGTLTSSLLRTETLCVAGTLVHRLQSREKTEMKIFCSVAGGVSYQPGLEQEYFELSLASVCRNDRCYGKNVSWNQHF